MMSRRLPGAEPATAGSGRLALLVALLLTACGEPSAPAQPYRVLVYDYDEASDTYALGEVSLHTLNDLDRLDGEVTTVYGGTDIVLDPLAALDGDEDETMTYRAERPVEPRYVMQNGVAVPEDFNTLALLTWYSHLERTSDFLHAHGLPADVPGHRLTHHLPTVSVLVVAGQPLLSDNAGFAAPLDGFALFPRHLLTDQTPLAMNLGVVAHEYAHAVLHGLTSGRARMPITVTDNWAQAAVNAFGATNEGMADVVAALVTDDPDFMRASLPDYIADDRVLTEHRELTAPLAGSIQTGDALTFDPYAIGSVIASALWRLREDWGRDELARVAVAGLAKIAARVKTDPEYTLLWLSEALYEAAAEPRRARLCEVLEDAAWPLPAECPR